MNKPKIQANDIQAQLFGAKLRNCDKRHRMLKDALVDLAGVGYLQLPANQVKLSIQRV
jgi:hypothetical protein